MSVCINGVMRDALINSECTRSLVRSLICGPLSGHKTEVLTVDRKSMTSRWVTSVNLRVVKRTPIVVDMLAMEGDLLGFDLLLGLGVIPLLGGVHINEYSEANFPNKVFSVGVADAVKIEWPDFDVIFHPTEKKVDCKLKVVGWAAAKTADQSDTWIHCARTCSKWLELWIANLDSQWMIDTIPWERARSPKKINPTSGNCSA